MTCRPLALFLLCASSPGFAAESLDWATIGRIRDEGCFQLIQDPIEYSNGSFFGTHHTDMDVYDRLQRDDLMQAAVVIATFAYAAANRDELVPRKPLPPVAAAAPAPPAGRKVKGTPKTPLKAGEAVPGAR